jgi:hypothetical protein
VLELKAHVGERRAGHRETKARDAQGKGNVRTWGSTLLNPYEEKEA